MKKLFIFVLSLSSFNFLQAQYSRDMRKLSYPQLNYLNLGNPGPVGKEIRINNPMVMRIYGLKSLDNNIYFEKTVDEKECLQPVIKNVDFRKE